jgi:hypothetical protein
VEGEGGLVLCSWPRGGRPRYPFPYSDECWTGIEYEVAALLIHLGLVEEGLEIVEGVRARYDGQKRNPFDEVECGHHYARAMSSWSLLLALSGYRYHAPSRTLGFTPKLPPPFRCFWSTGGAWGSYAWEADGEQWVEVRGGALTLSRLELPGSGSRRRVSVDGKPAAGAATGDVLVFDPPLSLATGQTLTAA